MRKAVMERKKINWNRSIFMFVMMLLPFVNFAVSYVYCSASSYIISFQNQKTMEWTFEYYQTFWYELTMPGNEINIAVLNALKFWAFSFVLLFLNFVMAYFFYKKVLLYKAFRILFYLPAIFSGVMTTTVFMEFIKPMGPLGSICNSLGIKLPEVGLLSNQGTALPTILIYTLWIGFTESQLLFAGAFGRIPLEVIEAGKLDGVKPMTEAFRIIFPLIWPTFSTMVILNSTGILSGGGVVQLMTDGKYGTMTLSYWMFKQLYGGGSAGGSRAYGILSAGSISMSLITVPIILFVRWLTDRIPAVEY